MSKLLSTSDPKFAPVDGESKFRRMTALSATGNSLHEVAVRQCRACGVSFRLCASDEELMRLMCGVVPFGTQFVADRNDALSFSLFPRRESGGLVISIGLEEFGSGELGEVLQHLEQQLLLHVGGNTREFVFLHAGVVGWQGKAILLPGASFAGKTTLVAELIKAGAVYYSDDYALLSPDGRVHPYARHLQIRQDAGLGRRRVAHQDLAREAGSTPLAVGQVVFTAFVDGARWKPEPLTAGQAVLAMLQHTLSAQRRPAEVMATLASVMQTARASQSTRGEWVNVVAFLLGDARC